jgi:ketosteroid isomerase-like protein
MTSTHAGSPLARTLCYGDRSMSKRPDDGVETLIETTEEERPMGATQPTALTRELNRVEEANLAFYEAFQARDIQKMERVWSRSPHSRCVHPGWEPVVGWSEIRQSWVDIFRTIKSIEFELEDVHVEVSQNTAWLNLVAHAQIVTEDDDAFPTSVVSTSIFERIEGQWYIMLHHSSHFSDEDDGLEDDEDEDEDDQLELDTDDLPTEDEDKPN